MLDMVFNTCMRARAHTNTCTYVRTSARRFSTRDDGSHRDGASFNGAQVPAAADGSDDELEQKPKED